MRDGNTRFFLLLYGIIFLLDGITDVTLAGDASKFKPLIRIPASVSNGALNGRRTDSSDRQADTNDQDSKLELNVRTRKERAENFGQSEEGTKFQLDGVEARDQVPKFTPEQQGETNPRQNEKQLFRPEQLQEPSYLSKKFNQSTFFPLMFVNSKQDSFSEMPMFVHKPTLLSQQFRGRKVFSSSGKSRKFSSAHFTREALKMPLDVAYSDPKFTSFQLEETNSVPRQVNQSKRRLRSAIRPLEKRAGAPTLWSNLEHPFSKHASPKSVHLAKRSVYSALSRKANDAIVGLVDGDAGKCGIAWTASSTHFMPIYSLEMVDFFPQQNQYKIESYDAKSVPLHDAVKKLRSDRGTFSKRNSFAFSTMPQKSTETSIVLEGGKGNKNTITSGISSSRLKISAPANIPGNARVAGPPKIDGRKEGIAAVAKTSKFPALHSTPVQKLGKSHFSQVQKEQTSSKTGVRNSNVFAQQVPQLFPGIRGSEMEVMPLRGNRTTQPTLVLAQFSKEALEPKGTFVKEGLLHEKKTRLLTSKRPSFAELVREKLNPILENALGTRSTSLTSGKFRLTSSAKRQQGSRHQSSIQFQRREAFDTGNSGHRKMGHSSLSSKTRVDQSLTYGAREKIIGGRRVMRGAFPWMVALVDKMKLTVKCGGTIISQGWVLTAAHCVLKHRDLFVSVGEHDVKRRSGRELYYEVNKVHFYEGGFNFQTYDNDIALLLLSDDPVKVSKGSNKPPRDVTNMRGIPIFSHPTSQSESKKGKISMFSPAFHLWTHLLNCMPKNNTMSEVQEGAYIKHLSLIYQRILEDVQSPTINQNICLPPLFIEIFSVVATGKPLPMIRHCNTHTETVIEKQKQSLEIFKKSAFNFPPSGFNIELNLDSDTSPVRIPHTATSFVSGVAHTGVASDKPMENPLNSRPPLGNLPFLRQFLLSSNSRIPSVHESISPSPSSQRIQCPAMLPEDEIDPLIDPRNRNEYKFLRSNFAKAFKLNLLDENNSILPPQTAPLGFLHYRACLPNPQFFKSSKLKSSSISSPEALTKIDEYQQSLDNSAVNPSTLRNSPSKKVANSLKPVNLGRAQSSVIRSTDAIHDTEVGRADQFPADGPHEEAISDSDELPGLRLGDWRERNEENKGMVSGENNNARLESQKMNKASAENEQGMKLKLLSNNWKIRQTAVKKVNVAEKADNYTTSGIDENFEETIRELEKASGEKPTIKEEDKFLRSEWWTGRDLRCVVLGWGKTGHGNRYSDVLQHAKIPILSPRKCQELNTQLSFTDNMICAGDLDTSKDTRAGDSGGPLLCEDRQDGRRVHWTVVGVTSLGVGAGGRQLGVYTNVLRYTDWIKLTIGKPIP